MLLDELSEIRHSLLSWFRTHQRPLPWRSHATPYRILISEYMLQQTQVSTMLPYYQRFLQSFPDIQTLAAASEEQVLAHWSGLGYYRRARQLLAAAREVTGRYHGELPRQAVDLQTLPGIGPYTARAVASIAHGEPVAVLDGNVKRVLARHSGFAECVDTPQASRLLSVQAQQLLDRQAPGDHNQAMMELGALICKPQQPLCGSCPIAATCQALAAGVTDKLPVRRKATATLTYSGIAALVLRPDGKLWLIDNTAKPLHKSGIYDPPVYWDIQPDALPTELAASHGIIAKHVPSKLGKLSHAITRHRMQIQLHTMHWQSGSSPHGIWLDPTQESHWRTLPLSGFSLKVMRCIQKTSMCNNLRNY